MYILHNGESGTDLEENGLSQAGLNRAHSYNIWITPVFGL